MFIFRNFGKVQLPDGGSQPDKEDQQNYDDSDAGDGHHAFPEITVAQTAQNGRHTLNVLSQNSGNFLTDNNTENTTAPPGTHPP